MKVVLDTNVLVSVVLTNSGPPAAIIRSWRAGRISVVISPALLQELADVLGRARVRAQVRMLPDDEREFLAGLVDRTLVVIPTETINVVTADPDDNRVLEAAVEGEADYVVSGDRHLLDVGEYSGIPVVTPARFVAILLDASS